jgi:hypothetical protein
VNIDADDVRAKLQLLVGMPAPESPDSEVYFEDLCNRLDDLSSASTSQLDQLLITVGFNRPSAGFHSFFRSLSESYSFEESLTRWRELSMLRYGNLRYPYRELARLEGEQIKTKLAVPSIDLEARSEPVLPGIDEIEAKDTPFLGYLAGKPVREIEDRSSRGDELTRQEELVLERYQTAQRTALSNTYEYCTSPFMDVYVATSMRDYEDFVAVHRFAKQLFTDDRFNSVAYFDPTQSNHPDRIVKGIIEGMMLKRAAATVYLAQEKETLGKDSELASTLAQGKVVIAFIPKYETSDLAKQLKTDALIASEVDGSEASEEAATARLLDRTKTIDPELWFELENRQQSASDVTLDEASLRLAEQLSIKYEQKAQTLRESHPLGLQVHLETGVANGILVARTVEQCRELVWEALTGSLKYEIVARAPEENEQKSDFAGDPHWDRLLVEQRTQSIHRVVIGDDVVTNSFWNWYMGPD